MLSSADPVPDRTQDGVDALITLCAAILLAAPASADTWAPKRKIMVDEQLRSRDIRDRDVLQAMSDVPRHLFVPLEHRELAYEDSPLPIGESQTISQPYIVAFMTQAASLKPTDRVLEIGTGSGYQAAILSRLVKEVYTIEIIESLSKQAQKVIGDLKYGNIRFRVCDGYGCGAHGGTAVCALRVVLPGTRRRECQ